MSGVGALVSESVGVGAGVPLRPVAVARTVVFYRQDVQGCGFYRCEQPVAALRRAGVAAHCHAGMTRVNRRGVGDPRPSDPEPRDYAAHISYLKSVGDTLVFQRPVTREIAALVFAAVREGRRVLVELDDDMWHLAPHNPAAPFMTREARDRLTAVCRAAAAVIVSTATLADVVRRVTGQANIVVIPNAVDPDLAGPSRAEPGEGVPLRAGWAGGSSHRADFRVAARGFAALEAEPGVEVHLYGDDPLVPLPVATVSLRDFTSVERANYRLSRRIPARLLSQPKPVDHGRRHFHPWTYDLAQHFRNIAGLHVGCAPLDNSSFNRSKSGLKWMEYALSGTPAVVSPVVCYEEVARHGETALFARTPAEWAAALLRLARDAGLRRAIGEAARETVLREHTIARRVGLYREVLDA